MDFTGSSTADKSATLDHLFVVGYPGDVGGANTECWHTLRLWRKYGIGVTLIPTWKPTDKAGWRLVMGS